MNVNINIKMLTVLSKLNYTLFSTLGKNLEELGIQPTIYAMLGHLNEVERAKTQKLGEIALITSGTITHTVNKMIKLGYVTKEHDLEDKRVYWVQITEKGRSYFQEVHQAHMAYVSNLLAGIDDDEKQAFTEQIKYFGKTIEQGKEKVEE